ncbi:MAG: hypothetical protein ACXQT3_06165 [Methermicoccaceae archaeon]
MRIFETIWIALNSPAGIAAMAGFLLWLLNKLYSVKPGWKEFEGTIIAAIKFAERQIPDDTANKSFKRLDTALRYVLKVYEEVQGRKPTKREVAELREGIQVKHSELEAAGTL